VLFEKLPEKPAYYAEAEAYMLMFMDSILEIDSELKLSDLVYLPPYCISVK
jgi:hypothetical protein